MHRIGNTRYYVYHEITDRKYTTNWAGARRICANQKGFRMARLENITNFARFGRQLEKWVNVNLARDTWYWLDAKFNPDIEKYVWGDDVKNPLTYTNFFYRYPRPTGVGSQISYTGRYSLNDKDEQCLTIALPYPGLATTLRQGSNAVIYGHSTTFDERACRSRERRRAICESTDPECSEVNNDPFSLTEGITVSQFWTDWTYELVRNQGVFYDASHVKKADRTAVVNGTDDELEGRSNKFNQTFCVAMQMSYEFTLDQVPCPPGNAKTCSWNFIQYVPANCNNFQGTICQHADYEKRPCMWMADWVENPSLYLSNAKEATVEFGFTGNTKARRSRYKQTFGSLLCPLLHKMARANDTEWYQKPATLNEPDILYKYDYLETYWVVDEGGFEKRQDSMCKVSVPNGDGFTRKLETVPCTEWHFYICLKGSIIMTSTQVPYEPPKAIYSHLLTPLVNFFDKQPNQAMLSMETIS
ncbi:unnamed protein product [Orchesella dallaii]|uniref:C-type lectin domain-containing protein n=1 Tax=Orchesella dallaii TaxID=48710 RepID=A0ABP1RLB7_9HEXA